MQRLARITVITAILAVAIATPVGADDQEPPLEPLTTPPAAETEEMADETPQLWFVELASAPADDGTSLTTLKAEKKAFRDGAATAGLKYSERFAFDRLWNGLSIQVNRSDITLLTRMPGVKALYPVVAVSVPVTSPLENPDLAAALSMTGADIAQNELGLTGAGVRVAVIDSGIDYDHPDLGGCFGQGCRVAVGWDFVGDAFNADAASPAYHPVPEPDPYPDDCNGHGTHVAGIIGANGGIKGVAPAVTFGAYRVFGCGGSTTADIVLAAMEQAQADDMQILNLSLGTPFQWPTYPTAQASDRLVNKGMVVVASAGNSGANGLYSADAPAVGKQVIGVASFDGTFIDALSFIVNPGGRAIAYLTILDAPNPPTSGTSAASLTQADAIAPEAAMTANTAVTTDVTGIAEVSTTPDVTALPEASATPALTAPPDAATTSDTAATADVAATADFSATPDVTATPDTATTSDSAVTADVAAMPAETATLDNPGIPEVTSAPTDAATSEVPVTADASAAQDGAAILDATTPAAQVVYVGRACPAGTGPGVPAGGDPFLANPAGKIALIDRGICSFNDKYQRVVAAGAVGVIISNNASGLFAGGGITPLPKIFAIGISQADGVYLRSLKPPVTLTWTSSLISVANPTGGLISSFSAFGLAPDLSLKPDLGAPGGLIRSTYPLEKGGYATLSGTSMSSPYVAGAVAQLLEARPNTSAQAVRGLLQNSADPHLWWFNPGLGFLDNVHRQGAGMLDIPGAILSTVKIEPGALSLGESEAGPAVRTLTIENQGPTAVTFNLSHAPAVSTGANTFSPSFLTGFASASFSSPSVTIPAGGTATVDVTLTANPTLPDHSVYDGYIVFTPQGGGPIFRVPYAGFKGDYQSIQVLTPTSFGFPWLAKLSGTTFLKQPTGATYTLQAGDIPYVLVHLNHPARRLRLEVFGVNGKAWHRALELEYVGRNSTITGFFAFPWDGVTTAGNKTYKLPNGTYVMRLSLLKALGNEDDPAHWENWTSPVITLARP